VHGGRVLTPPLSSGCLEGVTRGIVFEVGPRVGLPIEERTLFPEDLYSADEVIISSTNRNAIAASEVNGHKIAAAPGPVVQKLEKAIAAYVREYVEARTAVPTKR
jgi:branched-chain amino acid aminotransferase